MDDTIPDLLAEAADRDPEGAWLRADDGHLTFAGAAARVASTAVLLLAAGVRKGDLIVLTARTTPHYVLTWLALSAIGAVSVPTDPRSTAAELAGLVAQVQPVLIVSDDGLADLLDEADVREVPDLGVLFVDDIIGDWTDDSAQDFWPAFEVEPDDLAVLIPTSGTTGRSKLVMQTHRAYAWAGQGFPYWMQLTRDDVMMTSLPIFHINAPAYSVMGSLACGAGLVLVPRFSASGFLDSARRHGATEFNAIGAMLEILMRQPERDDDADTDLRLVYTGPSPTQEFQEAFERRFGLQIVCGYALSESPYGLVWPHGSRPFGTLGTVRQHPTLGTVNEAKVIWDDGQSAAAGEPGELLLRNPVVTPGYWQMPDETAATLVDGWLHTGDLVTVDDGGTYTFVSRKKEVLRRRGQNLSPAEVEDAITEHPDVLECAVVAVPSDLTEDDVKAFVALVPGREPDFEALREWTGQRLSAFKVPRFWQALDDLPRTPTSRVAKHRLPTGHPPGEYDAEPQEGP